MCIRDRTYTEPVSQYAQLSLQYRVAYNYQESDKKVYVCLLYTSSSMASEI